MNKPDRWLEEREKKDEVLYEKYGKPLEKTHKGKLAAIGPTGEVILGTSSIRVVDKALKKFGSGNFAFVRIGYSYIGKWLRRQGK